MAEITEQAIGNINTIEANNEIGLQSTSSPFCQTFYFEDYYDDKAVKAFIKSVEKLVRTSREYKTYIEELRSSVFALNHDVVLHNITNADTSLEFHHYPLNLYEIVETCMLHHIVQNEKFTSFSLAKEIMDLHFKHKIGIVPLSKTNHELTHSGNLFLTTDQIFGDYQSFIDEYEDGLTMEIKNNLALIEKYTKDGVPVDFKGLFK